MPAEYLPIFLFLAMAVALPVLSLLVLRLIRPSSPSKTKQEAYECGIEPVSNARGRYTVRYYLVAILFVIFEAETVFLFPWAVRYHALGWFGVAEAGVFLGILVTGYLWAWKKGAFEWI